ncbi:MAG: hypothetical protein WA902_07420 [Thermosynechococcaceae cyanobacterium]
MVNTSTFLKLMAQISLNIPDELLQQVTHSGKNPTDFFQERLAELSSSLESSDALAQKFKALASRWRQETRHHSLMNDIVLNPAYQQIIGMGAPAVPLILQDLKRQPDHWFWALRSITGTNPIQPVDRGRLPQMAAAWLQWGKEHGYQF